METFILQCTFTHLTQAPDVINFSYCKTNMPPTYVIPRLRSWQDKSTSFFA